MQDEHLQERVDECIGAVVVVSFVLYMVFMSIQGLQISIARLLFENKQEQERVLNNLGKRKKAEKQLRDRKDAKNALDNL